MSFAARVEEAARSRRELASREPDDVRHAHSADALEELAGFVRELPADDHRLRAIRELTVSDEALRAFGSRRRPTLPHEVEGFLDELIEDALTRGAGFVSD